MFLWSVPVQGITISESSQLSSVSQLGRSHPVSHYVHKLRSRSLEIAQTYCAIPRLRKCIAQFQDCANVFLSLKIGCAISRLARNFGVLRLCKFLDCAEHISGIHNATPVHMQYTCARNVSIPLNYVFFSFINNQFLTARK